MLLAGDLLACVAALPAAHGYLITELSFAALLIALFNHAGLYRSRLTLAILDDLPRIVCRWLIAVALMLLGCELVAVAPSLAHLAAVLGSVVVVRALLYAEPTGPAGSWLVSWRIAPSAGSVPSASSTTGRGTRRDCDYRCSAGHPTCPTCWTTCGRRR